MDSLTHLVAGALTPLAFRNTPRRAAVLGFGIAAGELPDIDVVLGNSPEVLLTVHRGITHALVLQPLLVLLVLLPFWFWLRRRPAGAAPPLKAPGSAAGSQGYGFGTAYLTALVCVYTHIYLDCMTTFGTMALLPFSSTRLEFPAMFIVDLLMTLPAMGFCIAAWRQKASFAPATGTGAGANPAAATPLFSARARRIARLGLAWVLLYPLAALGVNHLAAARLAPALTGKQPERQLQLLTEPFSPLYWKAVVDEGDSYLMGRVSLLDRPESASGMRRYAKVDRALYESLKGQQRFFGHFENFCPTMVLLEAREPDRSTLSTEADKPAAPAQGSEWAREYAFADLRYVASPDGIMTSLGRGEPMFVLEARVNASGKLLAYRFLKNADEKDSPWTEQEADK
ncbi:metal-dependent hydrolase [Desulfovibrio sp. OttesenSCG-928-A18]|nr:metal-dependent hydrolase [Desulfovibrio sp. OttesenSCG-928-A18]